MIPQALLVELLVAGLLITGFLRALAGQPEHALSRPAPVRPRLRAETR